MKRFFAVLLATVLTLSLASVGVFAAGTDYDMVFTDLNAYDEDGKPLTKVQVTNGSVVGDYVTPDQKIYIPLPSSGDVSPAGGTMNDVYNSDYFTFKFSRDQNGKYLDTVKFVGKRLGNSGIRADYIEVSLKAATVVEDVKVSFDVYFRARNDGGTNGAWLRDDRINTRFELWLNNDTQSGDATVDTGEGVVFSPNSNEENIITWGSNYEVASLKFTANSDAKKFYTKLTTKTNADIYAEYGDPYNADLYFRDFIGHPNIDATSRAALTLYNPWSEDGNNYDDRYNGIDPRDAYIYRIAADGYLEDITNLFTYVDADETEAGIDGWQIKVRTLGSYVISDTALDISGGGGSTDVDRPADSPPHEVFPDRPATLPPTGGGDMVTGAAFLMVVSCAAVFAARKRK